MQGSGAGPRAGGGGRRPGGNCRARPPGGKGEPGDAHRRAGGRGAGLRQRRGDHPPAGRRGPVSAHREKATPCRRAAEERADPAAGQLAGGAGPRGGGAGPGSDGSGCRRGRRGAGAAGRGHPGRDHRVGGDRPGRRPRDAPERPGSHLPAASHQERHGCAQKRLLKKSLKLEARVVPWRRRGGCSPAATAALPRFRLLFRHPVGSSPIGQFKPPGGPVGFRHLRPDPGVTVMPRPPQAPPTSGPRCPSPWRRATPPAGPCRAGPRILAPPSPSAAFLTLRPSPSSPRTQRGARTPSCSTGYVSGRSGARSPAPSLPGCASGDGAGPAPRPLSPPTSPLPVSGQEGGPESPCSSRLSCTPSATVCTDLL